ncbi:MAG: SDR family oxidoreductase, partial [Halocynthiibacter sp.]
MAKSILITGASSGIGRATADRFLREGWMVGLVARRAHALKAVASTHENAHVLVADVTDATALGAAFETFVAHAGRLDVLFNNAGVFGPSALIDEVSISDWR